jgi:NodT family efflux transporter outer membrane factor (OMF) lipoprotein
MLNHVPIQSVPSRSSGLALTALTALTAIGTALALLLTGCASPGDIRSHAQPLGAERLGLNGGGPSAAVPEAWWQSFNDAELDRLVALALKDNPNLAAARARVEKAQAQADALRANDLPRVDGSVQVQRQRYSENGIFPPPIGGATLTDGTVQAGLSWELDFFGRNRKALEAALGVQRAGEAEAQAAGLVLAANVARSYVQLARLNEQRDVAQRTLAQRQDLLALIRQRVSAGLDTNVELRQGEGGLPETRQQIEALDEQIALTRHALAALTLQPPAALDGLSPRLGPVRGLPLPANVPADLLGRRADVAAARWRVEAATQDMAVARTEFYPSVNLMAFAGFEAIGLDNLLQASSRQYGVAPALRLPIFDAGRLRANYRGRAADVDAAVASYNAAVLEAVRDVADQISSFQSVERQQREQVQAQAAAESAYELSMQRYKAGLGTYLTVLTAESTVLAQRRLAADLKARALESQVGLMRALGGGYTSTAAPALALAH